MIFLLCSFCCCCSPVDFAWVDLLAQEIRCKNEQFYLAWKSWKSQTRVCSPLLLKAGKFIFGITLFPFPQFPQIHLQLEINVLKQVCSIFKRFLTKVSDCSDFFLIRCWRKGEK